jgi:hypothetical protein
MTYDTAAIMKAAHVSTKKMIQSDRWKGACYSEVFSFYLKQQWIVAQHNMRAVRCTGKAVVLVKAFDNGGSPLWRL